VYGSEPLAPQTWDADSVFGCFADSYGYYHGSNAVTGAVLGSYPTGQGFLLDEFACPATYNPRTLETRGIFHADNGSFSYAVQFVSCVASEGYFQLSFRGEAAAAVLANDSIASLKAALEALTTIGSLKVEVQYGGSVLGPVCDSTGDTTIVVSFLTELGSLPSLVLYQDKLTPANSLDITSAPLPHHELYTGGGRGECNKASGECLCWEGWGSSDGFGDNGVLGDCGHNLE
jgi:hypothetical protein